MRVYNERMKNKVYNIYIWNTHPESFVLNVTWKFKVKRISFFFFFYQVERCVTLILFTNMLTCKTFTPQITLSWSVKYAKR